MKLPTRCAAAVVIACANGLSGVDASAAVLTNGCLNQNVSCTLQELSTGGSITIDGNLFGNWSVDDASSVTQDLSRINILPLHDQPENIGLRFDAIDQWVAVGLDLVDFGIRYTLTTQHGHAPTKDSSLGINQTSFGNGNLGGFTQITERVRRFDDSLVGELVVFVDNLFANEDSFDEAVFSPLSLLVVETNIVVNGDSDEDIAALASFTQRFSQLTQIPEPPTLSVLILGLAALTMRRHRSPA